MAHLVLRNRKQIWEELARVLDSGLDSIEQALVSGDPEYAINALIGAIYRILDGIDAYRLPLNHGNVARILHVVMYADLNKQNERERVREVLRETSPFTGGSRADMACTDGIGGM